jgi:hypothetical protein
MRNSAVFAALLLCVAPTWAADEPISRERFEALERRNEELATHNQDLEQRLEELEQRDRERGAAESAKQNDFGNLTEWARRIRISGSANAGYYHGATNTPFDDVNFQVWDLRLFLDADLGREITVGDATVARNAGFTFELNAVRLGELQFEGDSPGPVGETYVELQGIGGSRWFNAQLGRFQIPVGENYLRFSKGYKDNPFITNTVGGPWWWDEGLRVYGSEDGGRFGYVASISDGETPFTEDADSDPQFTLKLWARPTDWLYGSVSALRSGDTGSDDKGIDASGALWLGETWAKPIGDFAPWIPVFQDGQATSGNDASVMVESTTLVAADVVLTHEKLGRLWLGGGRYVIDAKDSSRFDRELVYWIAEYILQGGAIAPELTPFYLALRANGIGTYDDGAGYFLDIGQAFTLGYNMESLSVYSIALGWHLTKWTTLRAEFSRQEIGLVDGVPRWLREAARDDNYFGVELGAAF